MTSKNFIFRLVRQRYKEKDLVSDRYLYYVFSDIGSAYVNGTRFYL